MTRETFMLLFALGTSVGAFVGVLIGIWIATWQARRGKLLMRIGGDLYLAKTLSATSLELTHGMTQITVGPKLPEYKPEFRS